MKTKKKKIKWFFKLLILIIAVIFYAFFIGTKGVFTKEYIIKTNKISDNMHGIKILQFSDLLYGSSVDKNDLKKIVSKINETKPDVVIFTGNLIDKKHKLSNNEENEIIKNLNNISAELGKYYVLGSDDLDKTTSILSNSGFINLENNYELIYKDNFKPIVLLSKNNISNYYEDENTDKTLFKMLTLHNPNDLDKYLDYNIDVAIAGHTLNGQINILKIKDWLINGKYKNTYQKVKNTKLFINPGIGTRKINIRLFNHPTIYLYRISKST